MSRISVSLRGSLVLVWFATMVTAVGADVWTQTDWTGGPGQLSWSNSTMYYTGWNVSAWQSPGDLTLAWDLFNWVNTGDLTGAGAVNWLMETSSGVLYAATSDSGDVFASVDAGTTWIKTGDLAGAINAISVTEASDGVLYAGTSPSGDVFKSIDAGITWVNTGDLTGVTFVYSLIQAMDGALYAGTYPNGDVFKSVDAGTTWVNTGELAGASGVLSLIEASDGALYAGTMSAGDVYKSTDGGAVWVNTGDLTDAQVVQSIVETYDGTLYAGATCADDTARVFRSTDTGASWLSLGSPPDAQYIFSLIEPWAGALYAAIRPHLSGGVVFGSVDAGSTWIDMGLTGTGGVYCLLAASSAHIYAGAQSNGDVFRSGEYFATGYMLSSVYQNNGSVTYSIMTWNETLYGQAIQLRVRTDTLPDMSTAMDWGICPPVVNGQDISDIASVNDFHEFIQYGADLATGNSAVSPVLHDVSIAYDADLQGPVPDSAVASDGTNPIPGIDDDDFVTIIFDEATNKPTINSTNIDQVLELTGGHSWLDGSFAIGGANWNPAGDVLVVLLSNNTTPPTVAVNDIIIPDGVTITDVWGNPAVYPVLITGSFNPPGVQENVRTQSGRVFALSQNEPNPFSGETVITYTLPCGLHVTLEVYDLSGRLVETLVDGPQKAGLHRARWATEGPAAGIYFCRLRTGDSELTRKMVVVD